MAKISITACVIVKNEERNLPRWAHCVKQITDDLVVVDTGSTDSTVKIAEEAGATVYHLPWRNSFAEPKNFAIDHAKGDWILFLDADEYFTDEDCPKIRQVIEICDQRDQAYAMYLPIVNIDTDNHNQEQDITGQIRIFRNHPDVRYSGAIHEALTNSGTTYSETPYCSEAKIFHTGYSRSKLKGKLERNRQLLENWPDTSEMSYKARDYYLAEVYQGLGEYQKALDSAKRAMRQEAWASGRRHRPYMIAILMMGELGRGFDEMDAMIAEGERVIGTIPDFRLIAGRVAWARKDYVRAEAYLREALRRCEDPSLIVVTNEGEERVRYSNYNLIADSYAFLGKIHQWRGEDQAACGCFAKALKIDKYNNSVFLNLCRVLPSKSGADAVAALNAIYDEQRDGAYLAAQLSAAAWQNDTRGLWPGALHYNECGGGSALDEFTKLRLQRRYDRMGEEAVNTARALVNLWQATLAQGVRYEPNDLALLPTET